MTTMAVSFHDAMDRETAPLWEAIYALPFVREVGEGTLDTRRFAFFITQDVHYLDEFARVLTRAAGWADDGETRQFLLTQAQNVHAVEQALHGGLAPKLGLDIARVRAEEPAPTTVAYTDHMLRVAAAGPLAEVIAAVLPCYWVYQRVGERLAAHPPAHDLYGPWVTAYASPEFGAAVRQQLALVDRLAEQATEATRARMRRWFHRSLRYEWMFWDQAYREARWPVGDR